MKKNNGYILLDSLVAGAVLLFLLYTMIPIASLLVHEREALSERRLIASMLHDDLQVILTNSNQQFPFDITETFNTKEIKYHYNLHETTLIEACATWVNVKNRNEEVCLYGPIQKQ